MNSVKIKPFSAERERERGEWGRERKGKRTRVHIDFLILFDIYFCTADPLGNNYNRGGGEHMRDLPYPDWLTKVVSFSLVKLGMSYMQRGHAVPNARKHRILRHAYSFPIDMLVGFALLHARGTSRSQ